MDISKLTPAARRKRLQRRQQIVDIWRKVYGLPETTELVGGHDDWAFWEALLNAEVGQ